MSTATKIVIGVLGAIALVAVIMITSVVGTYNSAINQEEGIEAQYKQNQNNYSNFVQKVVEVSQVPAMYAGDMEKIYSKVVQGREGSDQELFRFIQEQNPNFDTTLYRQVQQVIEAGRDSFQTEQKTLLDKVRVYQTTLKSFPNNVVLGAMGFPKKDLAKFDIVTDDVTATAFETKKAKPIQLRPAAAATN